MKCAVITYIFGKNKELLREPKYVSQNIEYICVTDQKNLSSKCWKIVYDSMPNVKSLRDKFVYVKFNPFKYTNADKICVIDSSLEIKENLMPLFDELDSVQCIFKKHSIRKNLNAELPVWRGRGLKNETITRFNIMAKHDKINLKDIQLIESCVFFIHNNSFCKELCLIVIDYMKLLGDNGNLIITNQCPLSYIISLYYKDECIFIDYNVQKLFFNRYEHNTNKINKT